MGHFGTILVHPFGFLPMVQWDWMDCKSRGTANWTVVRDGQVGQGTANGTLYNPLYTYTACCSHTFGVATQLGTSVFHLGLTGKSHQERTNAECFFLFQMRMRKPLSMGSVLMERILQ